MTAAADVLHYVQLAVFVTAAVVAAYRWLRRRGTTRAWLAATLGQLALVVAAAEVMPEVPETAADRVAQKALVLALLLFPYFLYRFMATFERPPRALATTAHLLTGAVLVTTLLIPRFPTPEEPRSAGFAAYTVLVLVQWTLLSGVVAVRLWRAGHGQPTVARRRMRMLASGAAALAFALVITASAPGDEADPVTLVVYVVAILSAVLFLLGFAPPRALLRTWRARDIEALQEAFVGLAQATTTEEVVDDLLPRVVSLVGAQAAAIRDARGRLLGRTGGHAAAPEGAEVSLVPGVSQVGADHLRVSVPGGRLELWTTTYTPYFGREELGLIRTVAALVLVTLERTEAHARETAAREALDEAQHIAKLGSWRLDLATGMVEASDEMYRLWGLEPQAKPLTREVYRSRVHPDDVANSDAVTRAAETGEDFSNEFRLLDDDGTVRWVHTRGRAQRDESGKVVALLGTAQDVTEARRLDQMRRDFVANAAHELRTPLTTVSGMATLLATQRDRLSQAELDHAFAALGRQGQRARQLVTNLLDLSRLEAGRVSVDIVPVDVREVVGHAVETAPPPDGVTVTTDVDGARAAADPHRLEEVVVNLLTNAYRYGGANVRVTAAPSADGRVVLAVSDDGEGVPESFVPELFEPFSRGGAVTGTPGSGLGLAISQRLARAQGGDLTYEPNGSGARFVVRLRSAS